MTQHAIDGGWIKKVFIVDLLLPSECSCDGGYNSLAPCHARHGPPALLLACCRTSCA